MVKTKTSILKSGDYWIGSDVIQNAGPRHLRRLLTDVWIDNELITWRAYEAFVSAGGYANLNLWRSSAGQPFAKSVRPESVDNRCETIRSLTLADIPIGWQKSRCDLPLLGLTWFEANAVCRFFGGRLPFETEWEAAVTERLVEIPQVQEWCLDAYMTPYWRADTNLRGSEWQTGKNVVTRGHCRTEPAFGTCTRRPVDPSTAHAGRSFRRVWERDPSTISLE